MMFLAVVHGDGEKGGWYWPRFVEASNADVARELVERDLALRMGRQDFRGSGTIGGVWPVPVSGGADLPAILTASEDETSPIGAAAPGPG